MQTIVKGTLVPDGLYCIPTTIPLLHYLAFVSCPFPAYLTKAIALNHSPTPPSNGNYYSYLSFRRKLQRETEQVRTN